MEAIQKNIKELIRDISAFGNIIPIFLIVILVLHMSSFYYFIFGYGLVELIGSLLKLTFFTERPKPETTSGIFGKIRDGSFPSLHTARSVYTFSFIASQNPNNVYIFGVCIIIPILVMASRIMLKKHRLIDIIFGVFLGGTVFYYIWLSYLA